jgi:hypothetical protein
MRRHAEKAEGARPEPEQLVFSVELRVGDVIEDDGSRAEVIERPTASSAGKMTRAWIRREGAAIEQEVLWEAWRRVKVVKRGAA